MNITMITDFKAPLLIIYLYIYFIDYLLKIYLYMIPTDLITILMYAVPLFSSSTGITLFV